MPGLSLHVYIYSYVSLFLVKRRKVTREAPYFVSVQVKLVREPVLYYHNAVNIQTTVSHLLSAVALLLATVEAATGTPRVEPSVTSPSVSRTLLPKDVLDRKLGNVSSSRFRKLSMSVTQQHNGSSHGAWAGKSRHKKKKVTT